MYKSKYQNFTPFIIFLLLWSGKMSSANLKITPSQLNFAGETGSIINRRLLLETDSTVHFAGIPMDLVGSDECKILSASSIKVLNIPDSLLIQNPCMITVQIDLNHIAPGEYRGLIWLRSKTLSLSVPVKVQVKDSPFFPILILIVGVISGLLIIYFHQREKPQNIVLIRLSEIRSVIRTESEMIPCFREQLEACQYDIETLIHAEKWDEAILLISDLEKAWDRWRQGRSDWIALFCYYLDLKKKLENSKLNVNSYFLKTTSQRMEEAIKNAPNLESPGRLFEKLDIISQHLNLFIQLQNEIDELNRLRNDIPGEHAESWRSKINDLQQQLFDLEPSAASDHQKIHEEIKNALLELKKLVNQHGLKAISRAAVQPEMVSTRFIASVPPMTQKNYGEVSKKSDQHQEILKYLVFLLIGLLIASIGYHQLFSTRPTFGANVWIEYFSLFIWGFCAEVSLSPIIQLIRK